MRPFLFETVYRRAHPRIGGARLDEIAPTFDHDLEWLKCPARYNGGSDHHAPRDAAVQRKMRSNRQHNDLREEASKLRCAADPEAPVQRAAVEYQPAGLIAAPVQDVLVEHSHGVDDLGIARQRLGLGVGPGCMQVGGSQGAGGRPLICNRDRDQHEARYQANGAQSGMDQKNGSEIDRRRGTSNRSSITGLAMKLLT